MTFRKALAKATMPPIRFPDSTSLRNPVPVPYRGRSASTSYSERNKRAGATRNIAVDMDGAGFLVVVLLPMHSDETKYSRMNLGTRIPNANKF